MNFWIFICCITLVNIKLGECDKASSDNVIFMNSFINVWQEKYDRFMPTLQFIKHAKSILSIRWNSTIISLEMALNFHDEVSGFYDNHRENLQNISCITGWCEYVNNHWNASIISTDYTYMLVIHHAHYMKLMDVKKCERIGLMDGAAIAYVLRHMHDWNSFEPALLVRYIYCIKRVLSTNFYPSGSIKNRIEALKSHLRSMYEISGGIYSHNNDLSIPLDVMEYASEYQFLCNSGLLISIPF